MKYTNALKLTTEKCRNERGRQLTMEGRIEKKYQRVGYTM
jgi:hypothetical protein